MAFFWFCFLFPQPSVLGLLDFLSGCPSLTYSLQLPSDHQRPRNQRPSDRERQATANSKRLRNLCIVLWLRIFYGLFCYLPRPTYGKIAIAGDILLGSSTFIESSIFIMVFSILNFFHMKRRLSEKKCEIIKKPQGFSSKVKTRMKRTIFGFLKNRRGFSLKVIYVLFCFIFDFFFKEKNHPQVDFGYTTMSKRKGPRTTSNRERQATASDREKEGWGCSRLIIFCFPLPLLTQHR